MKVCELHDKAVLGEWVADWSQVGNCDYTNLNEVITTHRPALRFRLFEDANYKQIMQLIKSDMGNYLYTHRYRNNDYIRHPTPINNRQDRSMRERARNLAGVNYKGFVNDTMIFWVTSEIRWTGIQYTCSIRFLNWDDIGGDPDMTPREKGLRLLNESPIQLDCDDPSFLYWGYQYILTQMNAAIEPENRPPVKRNPGELGVVCKHLHRVLLSLPFYNGDIAKAITQQWGGKINKREIDAIRRRYDLQQQANEGLDIPPKELPEVPPEVKELGLDQTEQSLEQGTENEISPTSINPGSANRGLPSNGKLQPGIPKTRMARL